MTDDRDTALYLRDLVQLVKEMALGARLDRDAAVGGLDADLKLGKLMAWHEIVSLMQQQARVFGIDLDDIALGDIDPERDLV
jgi:hypothetical protein